MADATRTVSAERIDEGVARSAPQLIVLVTGDHPLEAPSRHLLAGVDVVGIGRGARRASRRSVAGVRRLDLALPDRGISAAHVVLTRVHGSWIIEDAGSKNGTTVDGVQVRRARLVDGAVIQLGATAMLYRDQVAPLDGAADLDAHALPAGRETFSGQLAEAWDRLTRVATSDVPVCIVGETGTGKEVTARALHALSNRAGAFVAVNCGSIPATLVEASFFGHRRGSFSGALEDQPGFVRAADGGTLFLDELAELPPPAQTALLRVLQEREVVPVGAPRPVAVDVRICVAVYEEPAQLVERGVLRRDLAARIGGLRVRLPRLADRREDLGLFVRAIVQRAARNPSRVRIAGPAVAALVAHAWPDNIRELELALVTALALVPNEREPVIEAAHLPAEVGVRRATPVVSALSPDEVVLREALVVALRTHEGNVAAVARAMGKGRMQVHRWMKRFELDVSAFRA